MKKRRVGIVLELMWPYRRHMDVFAGTQRFAQDNGHWICQVDEWLHESTAPAEQLGSYDGIIARASSALARRARRENVPVVNVWFGSPETERLPGVFPDFEAVGRLACEHLSERGFRQFGCLSVPREPAHQVMINAYHAALAEAGHECHCAKSSRSFHRSGSTWTQFQQMLDEWMATWKPPIALFVAMNDVTTRYVVNACQRRNLRVPEDVALVTSTNEPLICDMPPPSLTSVDSNYEQIGYQAAQLLDQLMQQSEHRAPHTLVSPTGIIARDSTDFFAVTDPVAALAMRYIERHTRERIAVDEVAEAAGVSRRTLERRFHASTGRSVAAEIRRLRMLKAKRLLAETDLLIKQVARETGFRDAIRLHEVFVREENVTPSEYRRIARGR